MRIYTLFIILLGFQPYLIASIDAYPFPDQKLSERYERLISELRCPQCLNTNLAGSDAMIAQDLRREVHRLLIEGKTDEQILDFMQYRYGDFILYKPRFELKTSFLWLSPIFLIFIAALVWFQIVRNRKVPMPLNENEEAKLNRILEGRDR